MARQPKKDRPRCEKCGKPGTKWDPLPHDHNPPSTTGRKPVPQSISEIFGTEGRYDR